MFISVRYFILFLFFSSFAIFFYIEPMSSAENSRYQNYKTIPQLSFVDFHLYDFDENQIVRTILNGSYGEGFKDGFYRVKDVNLTYKTRDSFENIRSDFAYYRKEEIEVVGDVHYRRTDGLTIDTERITYDLRDDYFYIPSRFLLYQKGSRIEGRTLVIKRRDGTINAFNIEAVIKRDLVKRNR